MMNFYIRREESPKLRINSRIGKLTKNNKAKLKKLQNDHPMKGALSAKIASP